MRKTKIDKDRIPFINTVQELAKSKEMLAYTSSPAPSSAVKIRSTGLSTYPPSPYCIWKNIFVFYSLFFQLNDLIYYFVCMNRVIQYHLIMMQ